MKSAATPGNTVARTNEVEYVQESLEASRKGLEVRVDVKKHGLRR